MANTQAICDTFRVDLLNGTHAFGAQGANGVRTVTTKDVFKAALYLASATYNRSTTAYSATGEVPNSGTYSAGGATVTNATAPANTGGTGIVAFWTPSASLSWTSFTGTAFDAMLLYNSSNTATAAVAVFTFGSQTVTAGTFTLTMPTNDLTTGLLRIS
jgi:hypothetical protein